MLLSSYFEERKEAMVPHAMCFDVDLLSQYLSSEGNDRNRDKTFRKIKRYISLHKWTN